ncbi:Osmotically-inducible protein Y precursor [Thiorhodovibrio winogradskyi]|uniref:Osmotically-inducible protein Y n=1 Tax=Thiorhodovibrio winogradskyi TaxID=77007 RepID=A0ABZ0SDJ8_9GAMM|nr:BON domain-containing protein [Thiorhodovibrio winogradskyi]
MTKHPLQQTTQQQKPIAALAAVLFAVAPLAAPLQAQTKLPDAGERIPGSDVALEARLITAYSLNEYLNPYDLKVDVEKGLVTLRGSVPSEVQRWLSERLARDLGIGGAIDNQLEVTAVVGDATPSDLYRLVADTNTTTRVQLRLLWNQATGDQPILVSTSDGRVRLHGTAGSERASEAALRLAKQTNGVRSVNNDIKIEQNPSAASANLTLDNTDAGIAERLRESLRFDTRVPARDIDTKVRDGAAILTGKVQTETQREQASAIANRLVGVTRVENRLRVEPQA